MNNMRTLLVSFILAISLLFTSTATIPEAVATAYVSMDHKPGHHDNGKHKGHYKKGKAKGYKSKRSSPRGFAYLQGNGSRPSWPQNPPVTLNKPKPHKPKKHKSPKVKKKVSPRAPVAPVAPKATEEKIKYVYVPVIVQSKPEVIVETKTKIDRVIYGAGVIAIGVVLLALFALFLGFFQGWRRRGKFETEKLRTLLE